MIIPIRKLCEWCDPVYVAENLIANFGEDGFIWLDSDGSKIGRWIVLAAEPIDQICSRGLPSQYCNANPFDSLRSLEPGHWTGWLSYEAGAWIEPNNPWKEDSMATLWIARHDPVLKFDLKEQKLWIEGCDPKRLLKLFNWIKDLKNNEAKQTSVQSKKSHTYSTSVLGMVNQ